MKRRQFLATLGLLVASPTAIKAATPCVCETVNPLTVPSKTIQLGNNESDTICTACGRRLVWSRNLPKATPPCGQKLPPHVTYNGPIAYSNGHNALFWKVK